MSSGLTPLADLILGTGVDACVGIPDTILAGTVAQLPLQRFTAPREDAAVAAAVGLELGGRHPVLFMKNAGLLTCGDALLSLARDCGVGLFLLVGWAGTQGDQLPHHKVTGICTVPFLDALGIPWRVASPQPPDPAEFAAWYNAARDARSHRALLVPPSASRPA